MNTNTQKRIADMTTNTNTNGVSINFRDGSNVTVSIDGLTDEIRAQLIVHGLKQKLIDAAALPRREDGSSATVEDKFEAVLSVADALRHGIWARKRESTGDSVNGGLLFRALCELYPNRTPDQIKAFLDGKTKEEQAALLVSPKIAPIIDTLRAKKAATIDADELLSGL